MAESGAKVVVALGGNALLRRDEPLTAEAQRRNLERAVEAVSEVARHHTVVLTHGNGPQVGLLAARDARDEEGPQFPLDVLGAETVGMIGYLLEQELGNRLPDRDVATLLTRVEVDPDDPAFQTPSKPIGPFYGEEEAKALREERGWDFGREEGGWRRIVPSPLPTRVLELETIRILMDNGVLVVCGGGGGLPVVCEASRIHGVEAVIDKDRTTSLLARELKADALLFLTDVDAVRTGWRTPDERPVRWTSPPALREMELDDGSMGPKVEAACDFVERTGAFAAIGALEDAAALLAGEAGTRIRPAPRT